MCSSDLKLPVGAKVADLPDSRSVLQLAYESRYDNFSKLIIALETSEKYVSNEPDLTLDALKNYLQLLANANQATTLASKAWTDKIAERNKIITSEVDSIFSDVADIKMQLKSMKNISKEQLKEINKFKFARS